MVKRLPERLAGWLTGLDGVVLVGFVDGILAPVKVSGQNEGAVEEDIVRHDDGSDDADELFDVNAGAIGAPRIQNATDDDCLVRRGYYVL